MVIKIIIDKMIYVPLFLARKNPFKIRGTYRLCLPKYSLALAPEKMARKMFSRHQYKRSAVFGGRSETLGACMERSCNMVWPALTDCRFKW